MSTTATRHRRNSVVSVAEPQPAPDGVRSAPDLRTQDIRARAYELYLARCANGTPGDAVSDWLRAEQELRSPRNRPDARANRLRGETLLRGED